MNIVESLAQSAKSRGVHLAFGEPVVADGMTVIPVAFVGYGFGGGGSNEAMGGGGGGGVSIPVGIYRITDGTVRFIPNPIAILVAGVPLVLATGIALSRILKALR